MHGIRRHGSVIEQESDGITWGGGWSTVTERDGCSIQCAYLQVAHRMARWRAAAPRSTSPESLDARRSLVKSARNGWIRAGSPSEGGADQLKCSIDG